MQIRLWTNFSKRKNSTKWPDATAAVVKNVVFKENTSLEEPSFIISEPMANYTYVQAFYTSTNTGHFYFVTDVINLNSGQCEIRCTQDILATYKIAINASSQFVERSSSSYNTMIPDPNVVLQNHEQIKFISSYNAVFDSIGCYILTVLNNKSTGNGFTTFYLLNASILANISNYCNMNPGDAPNIDTYLEWIKASFLKTADAIISCHWIPVRYNDVLAGGHGETETVRIGKDDITGIEAYKIGGSSSPILHYSYTINNFRSLLRYNDFRVATPFTRLLTLFPYYGFYELNAMDFNSGIEFLYAVDICSGDVTISVNSVETPNSRNIATINYNVAVDMPVAKIGNQMGNAVTSTLGTIAGAVTAVATGGATAVAGGITAVASGINAVASAAGISPSVKGSVQGKSMTWDCWIQRVIEITRDTNDPTNLTEIVGRPLMQYRALNGLTGYIKCADASVSINGRDADRDELNSFLNSGFYYE